MKFSLKILLITLYFAKDYDLYFEKINNYGFSINGFVYVSFFIFIFLSILVVSYIKNGFLRILLGFIFFASAISYDSYHRITTDNLDYNAFINLMDARGFIGDALDQYSLSMLTSLGFGLFLLIGISLKPKRSLPKSKKYLLFSPIFIFCLLTALIYFRGGYGAKGLPSTYTLLSYASLNGYEQLFTNTDERKSVSIKRDDIEINHDIILIIDESVLATYLDINEKNGVNSSLNINYPNIDIYNFGYAASVTNCSYGSNKYLRYGGTRSGYRETISTMPSIWRYAKNANLKTIYIDAQRTNKEFQNGMNDEELIDIDKFIQYNETSVRDRDLEISRTLALLINNNRSEFILVNKMGAHFPVHDKYPDKFMKYKPVLTRGNWLNTSDTGSRLGFSGSPEDWKLYRNSYRNTIEWNVGEFFSSIFKNANLNNAVILYTSDHGQDLHERMNLGVSTHCSSDPNIEEGLVPLVIIQGDSLKTFNWINNLNSNKNKSSHYNIFPTLLKLMHYKTNEITETYGNGLDMDTHDDFTFNINFSARLGGDPVWKKIDLNKIIKPSSSDFDTNNP